MDKNEAFYFSVGVNEIPWDRIVHWYGRATDFPLLFNDLLSDDSKKQKEALNKIKTNIEHQDGVIMATPFTLIFLFRLLSFSNADKIAILEVILVVFRATKFQLEFYEDKEIDNLIEGQIENIEELLSDQYLWPVFENKDQDEILWEEYDYSDEHYSWLMFIFDIGKAYSDVIKALVPNKFYTRNASEIYYIIHPPKKYF